MNEREKKQFLARYDNRTHLFGRIACALSLVLFVGAPFVMGIYLGAMPDLNATIRGFLAVGIVYLVSGIVEYLVYVPMLGSGGSYLAFITGNLINMKIPCAMTAKDIVGVKSGTKESEIVSTLSIATSSLVTILVLALGVLLLLPLQPVLQSPTLQPAFANVVPALFGAMAFKYYRKHYFIAAVPLLVMSALFLLVPSLLSQVSIMIIPSGFLAIGLAFVLFRKQQKAEQKTGEIEEETFEEGVE